MNFRKANLNDIEGVTRLQAKYLLANIPENERQNGFVTTPFTAEQLAEIIRLEGLFIAETEEEIIAYAFSASWDYFAQWPIFPYMVSRFPNLSFQSEIPTTQNSFQYGPICIHEDFRGSGLFQKLFETMRIAMNLHYPIGITFINKINKRSFEAHTRKLNMQVIDEFTFNNNQYYGLAFMTNQTVLEQQN